MSDRAVCLLSGGMDSAVAAAWATDAGRDVVALTIDYGQRHGAELDAARAVAGDLAVHEHVVLRVDLRPVGGSALTSEQPVPDAGAGDPIPATYVPARNTLFLALALGLAEARDAGAIVIGANHVDYSGYPDCRPAFLDAFRALAAVATKAGVEGRGPEVQAPLLDLSKREIVRLGQRFGVPFARTVSCYRADDDGRACGRCDACRLRADGFRAAGVDDPTRYAE